MPGSARDNSPLGPRDECAVLGVYAPGRPVGRMVLGGLIELNHRGQESAGIAVADGRRVAVSKGLGVAEVVFTFDRAVPELADQILAVGHDRYSTSGRLSDAQPLEYDGIVLAHNGNLTNAADLRLDYEPPSVDGEKPVSDSAVALQVMARSPGESWPERIAAGLRRMQGAYAFVLATRDTLYGARDPYGFRPLVLGRVEGGWVFASETCAFARMGATYEREVEPGEIVRIDAEGLHSTRLAPLSPAPAASCIFELVYLSRPDSTVFGRSVEAFRHETGRMLAEKAPTPGDVVMPVPRSGISAAIGYAAAAARRQPCIPFETGLFTNAYSGLIAGFRTFIQPTARDVAAVLKYSVIESVVRGRDLIVVDDSVVRGSFRRIGEKLRQCEARSIHLRVASPPLVAGCYYGVDFGAGELLANRIPDLAERAAYLGVDSLVHLSPQELVAAAVGLDAPAGPDDAPVRLGASARPGDERDVFGAHGFCGACFTGRYPTQVDHPIPRDQASERPPPGPKTRSFG